MNPTPDASGCNEENEESGKSTPPGQHEVFLVSKRECPLCDEARDLLIRLKRRMPFRFVERHIDDDAELAARHELEVPVLFLDGERFGFGHVEVPRLEAALRNPLP